MQGLLSQFRKWADFVKISHTLFAMPFALASMALAARADRGWPGWRLFGLIVAAMVCARTCAMVFNRIVDRRFDALNPRTATRHLPAGKVSLPGAWALWIASAAGLVAVSWAINDLCLYLSPVAILVTCFYSLTKRFTNYTHVYLGVALALAPVGAWLAVRGTIGWEPLLMAIAVVFWLVGFDIIYAIQDYEFDRRQGLHSLVVAWGPKNALMAAFLSHMLMWLLLVVMGLLVRFRLPYFIGMVLILGCLLLEHWLARRRSLNWVNTAFFKLNAIVGAVFLVVTVAEVAFPEFLRFRK